ncbi:MAG TPA: C45 family peptidase [Chloroflexota bacterium]|nr:C45 family peptidase [Chloroflexota bacterium]
MVAVESRSYRLPNPDAPRHVARRVPEGTVPLVAFEGSAYDCGRGYGEWARAQHPGYDRYLRQADGWGRLDDVPRRLFERHAAYVPELFLGLRDSGGRASADVRRSTSAGNGHEGCTSFAVSGEACLDGAPIAGQTKDVGIAAAGRFIALRLRITGGPTILVLAYPGEVLGLGMWSTGMALFRNALMSTGGAARGLSMEQWGLLALAGDSIGDAVEMAERHGIAGAGSHLIMDRTGASCSVEYNEGGVGVVPARGGISTHGNHPEAERTRPFEDLTWDESERENSRYRMHGLWGLLDRERGRLTAQRAVQLLGDHTYYPQGICRHWIAGEPESETVSAAVVEPSKGRLHVVRGQPCSNWPVTYSF